MSKEYKRQYRECPDEVRKKISASLKNRPKSATHKENISTGLRDYWQSVPSIQDTNCDHVEVDGFDDNY